MDYLRDPKAIYAKSFAIIRAEADLSRLKPGEEAVAIRLIHASGMTDLVPDLVFSPGAVAAGRAALTAGEAIICDTDMVRKGIISRHLKAGNPLMCEIASARARVNARALDTTLSAGAIEALEHRMKGAIVAIGNAPTALFHLLERLDRGWEKPALILGFPVGFVGAREAKAALIAGGHGVPFIALKGRRGGSAMAAAALNALAAGLSP